MPSGACGSPPSVRARELVVSQAFPYYVGGLSRSLRLAPEVHSLSRRFSCGPWDSLRCQAWGERRNARRYCLLPATAGVDVYLPVTAVLWLGRPPLLPGLTVVTLGLPALLREYPRSCGAGPSAIPLKCSPAGIPPLLRGLCHVSPVVRAPPFAGRRCRPDLSGWPSPSTPRSRIVGLRPRNQGIRFPPALPLLHRP